MKKAVLVLVVSALSAALLAACGGGKSSASGTGIPLVGTFRLSPGSCAGGTATGTYFRMILPGGTVTAGKFFDNPDSACSDKSYTPAKPRRDGGLVTGQYQPNPTPAFSTTGGATASAIVEPELFTAIDFSMSTNAKDPQTGQSVPAPAIYDDNGKLSGQIEAWSCAWNRQYFNQGSPKPDGSRPGLTMPLAGTYNAATHAFLLTWASQVVGGPFGGFTGYWHLTGTFVPAN